MSVRSSKMLPEYKLVVVGSGGVGKSCLTIQLVNHVFYEDYDPTIEDSYSKKATIDGEASMLDILDSAGQEEYAVMLDQYMLSGQGFLLVYSITNRKSFEDVKGLYTKLQEVKEGKKRIAVVLVGNKSDLESKREVSESEGRALARRWGVPHFETSAKKRLHVEDAFFELTRQVKKVLLSEANGGKSASEENALKKAWASFTAWCSRTWASLTSKDKPKRRTQNSLSRAANKRASQRESSRKTFGRSKSAKSAKSASSYRSREG